MNMCEIDLEVDSLKKTLVYGIGNPARGDDGLGWDFIDAIESEIADKEHRSERNSNSDNFLSNFKYFDFRKVMQLNIEDAEVCSKYRRVIFVDASLDKSIDRFRFRKIEADVEFAPFTHSMNPESVVSLSLQLYPSDLESWLLEIKGSEFELGSKTSELACVNLQKSSNFFIEYVKSKNIYR